MPGFTDPWASSSLPGAGQSTVGGSQVSVQFGYLLDTVNQLSVAAKSKIDMIRSKKSAMSIADMFDLQMSMNKLSQMSDTVTGVVGAINSSISSVNRNLKS